MNQFCKLETEGWYDGEREWNGIIWLSGQWDIFSGFSRRSVCPSVGQASLKNREFKKNQGNLSKFNKIRDILQLLASRRPSFLFLMH